MKDSYFVKRYEALRGICLVEYQCIWGDTEAWLYFIVYMYEMLKKYRSNKTKHSFLHKAMTSKYMTFECYFMFSIILLYSVN